MGTRNLTMVKYQGKLKIAQYGQWDGYPTGQGRTIAKFLRYSIEVENLKTKLANVSFYKNENEVDKTIKNVENVLGEYSNIDLRMPEINRDTGAKILEIVSRSYGKLKLINSKDFLKDGVFCEYAYMLNLDTNKITIYVSGKKYKSYTFENFASDGFVEKLENELRG